MDQDKARQETEKSDDSLRVVKDVVSGAAGGIAQVLLGMKFLTLSCVPETLHEEITVLCFKFAHSQGIFTVYIKSNLPYASVLCSFRLHACIVNCFR